MKPTQPKQHKNKISLKFMDCSVSIEGSKATEIRALSLLTSLIQDRLKVFELLNELEEEEEYEPGRQSKKKHLDFDSMFQ